MIIGVVFFGRVFAISAPFGLRLLSESTLILNFLPFKLIDSGEKWFWPGKKSIENENRPINGGVSGVVYYLEGM